MVTNDEYPRSALRSWLGVAVITASLFTFVTTELMPVGLLTPAGANLGVSVGVAGLMVALYGISAGLGVPFIVAWSRRVNRRVLLSVLLRETPSRTIARKLGWDCPGVDDYIGRTFANETFRLRRVN